MRVKAADAVTYVFLVLAAIALAVDTGMKSSPELKAKMPDFMNGQVWGFAPLALLILAGLLIVAKHWPWKKGAEPAPQGVRGPTPAIPIARGDPEEALPVEEQRATLKLRLKEARETAEAEVRTLRTDLGVATVRADTRETEARDLKLALEQSQGTIRALAWRLNYQAEFPLLPPIDEADLRGMVAP